MKVMSFNSRTSSLPDKRHAWEDRKQLVVDVVKAHAPDVVGFQEVQRDQLRDLIEGLPEYGCYQQGWQEGVKKQELLPIFYAKDRVKVVQSGTFWLNKTPDLPRIDDGGKVLRACTWIHATLLAESRPTRSSGRTYAIFNTHFDNLKENRREAAARLILERIAALSAGIPAILFGDLNIPPGSTTYGILRGRFLDAFVDSPMPRGADEITCHCFTGATEKTRFRSSFQWIDHILMDKGITCIEAKRVLDSLDNEQRMYPSDHWPVIADLI